MTTFNANNRDVACFLVVKHSWKGKYKRIFSIGTLAVSTYDPKTLEITNQWAYNELQGCEPVSASRNGEIFQIKIKKKSGTDHMRFSSEYTCDILTLLLDFEKKFFQPPSQRTSYNCFKEGWNEQRMPTVLHVGAASLCQLRNAVVTATYNFKEIKQIYKVSDYPGGFVIEMGDQLRRHLFASQSVDALITEIRQIALENVGVLIAVAKEPLTLDDFRQTRLGLCSRDELLTSYVEFKVQKYSAKYDNPIRRLMCLSEKCLIERDLSTYSAVCARPLNSIVCLSRDLKDAQKFSIEYKNGEQREYSSSERDLILASLIDGSRGCTSNDQICNIFVTGRHFEKNLRILPFKFSVDEEGEKQLLMHIIHVPPGLKRSEMIRRFNANIPYNGLNYSASSEGLFADNKTKIIVGCLEAVLGETYTSEEPDYVFKIEAQLACLHRLFASKAGFQAFTAVDGVRATLGNLVVRVLKFEHEAIDHATVEMLCSLMQPMHPNYELRLEQLNKKSLLSNPDFVKHLLDLVVVHVGRGTGALVIAAMLDFLTYTVCAPYSETTEGDVFDMILELVAERGRAFYKLFLSPSMTIVKGAGMVMRAIIEESSPQISKKMQLLSLTEGAFLTHLQLALLSTGKDLRVLANKQLSGLLITLWISSANSAAMELLERCIPRGLLNYLESSDKPPVNEADLLLVRNNLDMANKETKTSTIEQQLKAMQISVEARLESILHHWNLNNQLSFMKNREQDKSQRPVVLRKRRQRVQTKSNWKLFCYQFGRDHAKADLIWNEKTREEFRVVIENELRALQQEMEFVPRGELVSWNHSEFAVTYESLRDETKIGDYYLRFLLSEGDAEATPIREPMSFFQRVYHRFLLSTTTSMRCTCLKAMGIAYERHYITIGPFPDCSFIVNMLAKSTTLPERNHLIFLISKLVLDKNNGRELIAAGLLPILVDLAALAHLHTGRAKPVGQTNVIEAADMSSSQTLEWYYSVDAKGERQGPVSFHDMQEMYRENKVNKETQIWAEGMRCWMPLIDVAQFRWTVCQEVKTNGDEEEVVVSTSDGSPLLYDPTQLSVEILNILIQTCGFFPARDDSGAIIRPLPQVKKVLSDPTLLYPLVHLLLTYDSAIVERVATLLYMVMEDNMYISRLYLSGVFFFILMYNGSNILSVTRFLRYTHLKQAFRSAISKSELVSSSVLSPILPEANIFYLERDGPESYAEKFLGNFENPRIIWNKEMRDNMIEKLALHVSDFSCRLTSNVKAIYSYCPIPPIEYPQLEDELFCHYYYLRHLCDEARFPDEQIDEPETFLRLCLEVWYQEMEKKPASMSIEDACNQLGLPCDESWKDQAVVRRAYYKLANQYHPDKNPEGREIFQRINHAYEFLTSTLVRAKNAGLPDLQRIIICLRSQSIVYRRHCEELGQLKYAGYTSLIRTIDLETKDENLFKSGGGLLLTAAVELCSWTLKSSALNAEQLRRESGLEALYRTFERCVPNVNRSSLPTDMAVQVCTHVCYCFATAAQFPACREKIAEFNQVFPGVCHLLKFDHLHKLAVAAAECVCSFSVCTLLQTQLYQSGVIWQLLPHLFRYDFTLDEGGVTHSEDTNQQSILNKLARCSAEALACLAGFRSEHPDNDGVRISLYAMLTPYVCRLMCEDDNNKVLKILNSNSENPYIIWDNSTRAELLDFVDRHRSSNEQSEFGAEFRLSAYAKELIVGEIFVRVYNQQPDFKLDEPKAVCADLIDFLRNKAEAITGFANAKSAKPTVPTKPGKAAAGDANNSLLVDLTDHEWVNAKSSGHQLGIVAQGEMVLDALINVLQYNPGIEIMLIGSFPLISQFLRTHQHPNIQTRTLKLMSTAAANKECVNDIASSFQLGSLLLLLSKLPQSVPTILRILVALCSNITVVKMLLDHGGLLYILNVFINSKFQNDVRAMAAEVLGKLQSDKLNGPRWRLFIIKFLPAIFADAIRDNPATAVQMFDSTTENPELIWNDNLRASIQQSIQNSVQQLVTAQLANPDAKWTQPSQDYKLYQSVVDGEIIVGDIYIRLFNANPSWVVRHPKDFTTELMDKILELMSAPDQHLEPVATALCSLVRYQPNTADQISAQGYLQQFVVPMTSKNSEVSKAALLILNELVSNNECADSLSRQPIIRGIFVCMKQQPALVGEAAHALKLLMRQCAPKLVEQLLSTNIVPYLLDLLASPLPGVANPGAAKAEIVDALKSAILVQPQGDAVNEILEKSSVWAQYKNQRDDLFLPASRTQAITGPASTGVAGYLTNDMFHPPPTPNGPPPRTQAPPRGD